MEMQLCCQAINNSLGLPVSQQWGQHKTDTLTADTSWISDVCYKFHPSGTFFSQVWLSACDSSCNTAGNGWPEGPPCPHQLSYSLLQCSLDPSLLLAQELWFPAKSQGKAEVPEKLWIQAGWLSWHLCFHPCFLPFCNTHLEFISSVFCCCILSFPCSCIIQLFLLWQSFCPLFFTSQLPMLCVQEENSKPCNTALGAVSNGSMKGKGGKAALMLSIWKWNICFFCSQFC